MILNGVLWQRARQFERMFYQARLEPLVAPPEQQAMIDPIAGQRRVVLFGDSRVAQWPAPVDPAFQFINRGIDGHTSTQLRLQFASHVAPVEPDVVVVQAGANDLMGWLLFSDQQGVLTRYRENIAAIIADTIALGATPVLTTVFATGPRGLGDHLTAPGSVQAGVVAANELLGGLAAELGVTLINTNAVLTNADGQLRPEFVRDTWHLSPAAYVALNEQLVRVLKQIV
jgi:lysophospholipase L1-like esterase